MTRVTPEEAFHHATELMRHGEFARAVHIYRQLLQYFPQNVGLLNMCGTAELQMQHLEEGVRLLRRALELAPGQPQILVNLANGLQQQGHPDQALPLYERAIRAKPDYADAYFNRAIALTTLGRKEEACEAYRQTTQCDPQYAGAYYNRGNLLSQLGRYQDAVECYDRAAAFTPPLPGVYTNRGNTLCALGRYSEAIRDYRAEIASHPNNAITHYNCANALRELDQTEEALSEYDRALALQPNYVPALINRGTVLIKLEKTEAAIASFDAALALKPDEPEAWKNRGRALMHLRQYEAALASCDKALELRNDDPEAHNTRGSVLRKLGRAEEALAAYAYAVALKPESANNHGNRAIALRDLSRFDEALEEYDTALRIDPDYVLATVNKAYLLLMLGHIREGRALYECRWQRESFQKLARHFSQPKWQGDTALKGRKLFIWYEQGLGDFIQCARFAVMADRQGAEVFLEAPPQMKDLLATLPGHITLQPFNTDPPEFDLHLPIMSLPWAFQATEDMLGETVPYLAADPARRAQWRTALGPKTGPRIGITWAGNPGHTNDHNRSIAAAKLKDLFDLPFEFHLLQPDFRPEEADFISSVSNLHLHTEDIRDFADTAALMAEMDQIITVDTSVAHLAGALGLPLWLLLPHVPDARWMLEREDTPWYPAARLFRQRARGDWEEVLLRVALALQAKF